MYVFLFFFIRFWEIFFSVPAVSWKSRFLTHRWILFEIFVHLPNDKSYCIFLRLLLHSFSSSFWFVTWNVQVRNLKNNLHIHLNWKCILKCTKSARDFLAAWLRLITSIGSVENEKKIILIVFLLCTWSGTIQWREYFLSMRSWLVWATWNLIVSFQWLFDLMKIEWWICE